MTLAEKLESIHQASSKRIPPDKAAIMSRATQDLRASGIMDGAPKIGETLPAFTLTNVHGEQVRSSDLLAQGAVVLTVFRGSW